MNGYSRLEEACRNSDHKYVKVILGLYPNVIKDNNCVPLLCFSSGFKHNIEIVKLLVENGVDVNGCDTTDNRIPLEWSILGGQIEITKYLIENGADVNKEYGNGKTVVKDALSNGNEEMIQLFMENGADIKKIVDSDDCKTILFSAAYFGYYSVAKLLLDNGANVNVVNNYSGSIPLHRASTEGRADMVKLFLEYGADVNARDNRGWTPHMCMFGR
jgi:ankyrin repeat protein